MRPSPMDDPRDSLERATRWELYDYAKRMGCEEVKEPMPHMLAAQILRAKGHRNIHTNAPPLGSGAILGSSPRIDADKTVDAMADLKRQYEEQQASFSPEGKNFNEIRSELKRRGVKLSRRDTLEVLKKKLNGQ